MSKFEKKLVHNSGTILAAAHRGVSGANVPCNTKLAFNIAVAQGADIVELDVSKSRDGKLFVFHPGMEKAHLNIDCSLSEMTASEIEKMGGTIYKNAKVTKIHKNEQNLLTGLTYEKDGEEIYIQGRALLPERCLPPSSKPALISPKGKSKKCLKRCKNFGSRPV